MATAGGKGRSSAASTPPISRKRKASGTSPATPSPGSEDRPCRRDGRKGRLFDDDYSSTSLGRNVRLSRHRSSKSIPRNVIILDEEDSSKSIARNVGLFPGQSSKSIANNVIILDEDPADLSARNAEDSESWNSIAEDSWVEILKKVEATNPESVGLFAMCCRRSRQIVADHFAEKLSLKFLYKKVPGMSARLLTSMQKWWHVHRNVDAGIMLGMYQGWYTTNCSEGLKTLNEVIDVKDDPQAVYMANMLWRLKRCDTLPLEGTARFALGGNERHNTVKYRVTHQQMVTCSACLSTTTRAGYLMWTVGHWGNINTNRETMTCEKCVLDHEAWTKHRMCYVE